MKKDIVTREDIEMMLHHFYAQVFADELISSYFDEIRRDPEHHIPLIADFWESVLDPKKPYSKNLMQIHKAIHDKKPIGKKEFDRWVLLFTQTVNHFFEGPNAELLKQRARSVAGLMDIKYNYSK